MATPWASAYHAPVLADEVLGLVAGATTVLDATLGGGGHALSMLEHGVRSVIGVDRDAGAIDAARERLGRFERDGRFRAISGNYADPDLLANVGEIALDAILLDLGVSSRQLDDEDRGFTFRPGARLDMRMDPTQAVDAAAWLSSADEGELTQVLRDYADEPKARRMAREIVRRRENRSFETSDDLVGVIRAVLGPRSGPGDFARIFQAVRIVINDELTGLTAALPVLRDRLAPGGRLIVIAYHSGEDRIVKHAFRDWSADCVCPPKQPMCTCRARALGKTLTRKATTASEAETAGNPRARSARLRAWQSVQ